jgi:hypothetical protein
MDTNAMVKRISKEGFELVSALHTPDKQNLMLTSKLVRCQKGDTFLAAIGAENPKDEQIHAVVDAVHWCLRETEPPKSLRIVFGRRNQAAEMEEVVSAAALMLESLTPPLEVRVEVDFEPRPASFRPFNLPDKWRTYLYRRDGQHPPQVAKRLMEMVGDDAFRWYRNLSNQSWSGRVDGLQVCTINQNAVQGKINVGKSGPNGNGKAREIFSEINQGRFEFFNEGNLPQAAAFIRELIADRQSGRLAEVQKEHLLESRVLNGAVAVRVKDGALKPVNHQYPFQFPTKWAPSARGARYLDVLMHREKTPYAVELKEPNGSSVGQNYRHAISQALLYREFIRRTPQLKDWFTQRDLDSEKCRAVVAFPEMDQSNSKHQRILQHHKAVGSAFGVEVVELDVKPN